jgi:hypothetical protein
VRVIFTFTRTETKISNQNLPCSFLLYLSLQLAAVHHCSNTATYTNCEDVTTQPVRLAVLLSGYPIGNCSAEDFPTGSLPKVPKGGYSIRGHPTGGWAVLTVQAVHFEAMFSNVTQAHEAPSPLLQPYWTEMGSMGSATFLSSLSVP